MKQNVQCPYCEGTAHIKSEVKEIAYKQTLHSVEAYNYQCEKCLEEFTTTETDTATFLPVYK